MKQIYIRLNLLFLFFCISTSVFSSQDDTVKIYDVPVAPLIDGMGNDDCWANIKWQNIDQVWINYGENIDADDYSGRYKVIWSSKENLLYFLVEITDDSFIDGFVNGQTADVYNYDIVEVFIDEDKSGGAHAYESPGSSNAENAFGYHIYCDFPDDGDVIKTCWVGDIPIPHTDHLPEFAVTKNDNVMTREFSLKVYNDKYVEEKKEESRVTLTNGKVMGLSLAYCDNDDDDGLRDNFFGSVWVPADKYNNHWMESDNFGKAKLFPALSNKIKNSFSESYIYQNPVYNNLNIESAHKMNRVEIVDILGKTVIAKNNLNVRKITIPVSNLRNGVYFMKISSLNGFEKIEKIIKK